MSPAVPLYESYPDQELLALLLNNDRAAFTEIYNRYWEKLFYRTAKRLQNLHAAEELVQDVFLDIWKRRQSLDIRGELKHYLAVALKYRVINYQAKRKREQDITGRLQAIIPTKANATEEAVLYTMLQNAVSAIVDTLPEKCRLAFQLRQEGLSQKEIATAMNVSEKTVETHVSKALKTLRTRLGEGMFSLLII